MVLVLLLMGVIQAEIQRLLDSQGVADLSHDVQTSMDDEHLVLLQTLQLTVDGVWNRIVGDIRLYSITLLSSSYLSTQCSSAPHSAEWLISTAPASCLVDETL